MQVILSQFDGGPQPRVCVVVPHSHPLSRCWCSLGMPASCCGVQAALLHSALLWKPPWPDPRWQPPPRRDSWRTGQGWWKETDGGLLGSQRRVQMPTRCG